MTVDFTDRPNVISQDYYDRLRDGIIRHFSPHPDVISVYEYGSVKAPGISDLDLIVVCKDSIRNYRPIPKLGSDTHNIMGSVTLMLMPIRVFQKLQMIDPFHLNLLTGVPIEQEFPVDTGLRDLVSVIDWLPERLIRLVKLQKAGTLNINYTLGILYSFRYTIKKVSEMLDRPRHPIVDEIKDLRSNWFTSKEPEKALPDLIARTSEMASDLIVGFDKHLDITFDSEPIRLTLASGMDYIFDIPDPVRSIEESTDKKGILHLPQSFYPHFASYARLPGHLPKTLSSRISPQTRLQPNPLPKEYLEYQKIKMAICEENAQFILKNNLPKTLIRFGFWL